MLRYLNDPQATKDSIDEEGFFRTGDVVNRGSDGTFFIEGRAKTDCALNNPPKKKLAV